MINLANVTGYIKEKIKEIRVYNASGLFYTKDITTIEDIASSKYKITVYFDDTEANTTITQFKLYSADGKEIATATYNREKNQYQTLLIYWYMEVK